MPNNSKPTAKEWRQHKYIDKVPTKNGYIRYIYKNYKPKVENDKSQSSNINDSHIILKGVEIGKKWIESFLEKTSD